MSCYSKLGIVIIYLHIVYLRTENGLHRQTGYDIFHKCDIDISCK